MDRLFRASYYARYILPGLVFTFFVIVIPLVLLWIDSVLTLGALGAVYLLTFALIVGYVLDVMGVYSLNPGYHQTKLRFFRWIIKLQPAVLEEMLSSLKKTQPRLKDEERTEIAIVRAGEIIVNYVWVKAPDVISRIEDSRAKWVLALECSFSCFLSMVFWLFILALGLLLKFGTEAGNLFNQSVFAALDFRFQCLLVAGIITLLFIMWRGTRSRGFEWQFNQNEQAIFLFRESMQRYYPGGLPDSHTLIESHSGWKIV